ncbi:sulfatase-like hydrolase/transferase [Bremerella sp.]|uniref:sulfatase-like hydrolase/transferase n=1 Tax=Bremerella sp. TaxID=2795602 RepID=UPI00391CF1F3
MLIRTSLALAILLVSISCHVFAEDQSSFVKEVKAAAPNQLPNIVVILADDLGWNSVGYHNTEFKTPHIDSLVASGITLNRFYVAPMCSPTRAGLMTGRYPIRFGCARAVIPPYRDFGLPTSEVTLPEMLSTLGYENRGIFGKWHLGHRRAKWHPLAQGFTHFHGHYNGAIDYFELSRDGVHDWHIGYDSHEEDGYATDLIADAAATWIVQAAASDSPYFCYVPFNAPHSPYQAPEDAIERYGNLSAAMGRNGKHREIYKSMIGRMDEGVGRILKAVEASGESDNTLVWFFSDNGGVGNLRGINKPLRGAKLTVFEGGVRVPACVRWPAKITAGQSTDALCGYIDILPTLVAIAGGKTAGLTENPVDGIDLTTILENHEASATDRAWFSYHGQSEPASEHLAITDKGWKLVVNGPQLTDVNQLKDGSHEVNLFHLEHDLNETTNLAKQNPKIVEQLAKQLVDHRALQPKNSVPPYGVGQAGFVPPPNWALDPTDPDKLVGQYKSK